MRHDDNDGWSEYSQLVLAELRRLDKDVRLIQKNQMQILSEITALKVKSAMWGAIAGVLPATVIAIITAIVR